VENKKELGKFYTSNVSVILERYESFIEGKDVVDPMCGSGYLLDWARTHRPSSLLGYDIDAKVYGITQDTLMDPPDYSGKFILANPPYLLRNKSKDKTIYNHYDISDLYKASLLSFLNNNADEGILIIPSNFFVDLDVNFRSYVFSKWNISEIQMFDSKVFSDTNVRVCTFYFKKGITTEVLGHTVVDGARIGKEWYEYINVESRFKVSRLRSDDEFATGIILKATDTGSTGGEIHLEKGAYHYGKNTDRNIATIVVSDLTRDEREEDYIIKMFNEILNGFREQYDSMFLTNFLAGKDGVIRKRISFRDAYKLIARIIQNGSKDGIISS